MIRKRIICFAQEDREDTGRGAAAARVVFSSTGLSRTHEATMKTIRQIVVAVIGLIYVGLLYPLFTDLWHSKWLLQMK